jgi:hypothetical protein
MEDNTQEINTEEFTDSQKLSQILAELIHLNQRVARLEERDETRPALDRIYKELAAATFGLNDLKLEVRFLREDLVGERKERALLEHRISVVEARR